MAEAFDLVVVGGSFAGLVCARHAASRGLSVAVVERQPAPGAQVRTTGIAVKEADQELPLPPELTRRIPGIRVHTPGGKRIDLDSPGYYFLATDTAGLLRWLAVEAVQAGARLMTGQAFQSARREDSWIVSDTPPFRCRYLVGADGARSTVASCFGLGENRRFLVGVEAEFTGVAGINPDRLHCFVDSRLAPGYIAWVVPGVGVTQIGLACRRGEKPSLARFVERLGREFNFDSARVVGRRSGLIPVGGTVTPIAAEGVLLVGDAAGMVSPLTAGGIHPAFRYGRRTGEAISDHLMNDGPDPGALMRREYPRYHTKALLRRLLDIDPPNWFYDLTLGLAPVRALARLVYFHHKGFASRAAWRDFFRERK